jgi:hypothetical protein
VRESNEALATDVLQWVIDQKPVFLEQLVLTLPTAMGYGGRAGAGEHWDRSGDVGSMGWSGRTCSAWTGSTCRPSATPPTTEWAPDIEAFVGTLHGQQADRGLHNDEPVQRRARSYVERIRNRIVLIAGRRLAELMILHNVGMQMRTCSCSNGSTRTFSSSRVPSARGVRLGPSPLWLERLGLVDAADHVASGGVGLGGGCLRASPDRGAGPQRCTDHSFVSFV